MTSFSEGFVNVGEVLIGKIYEVFSINHVLVYHEDKFLRGVFGFKRTIVPRVSDIPLLKEKHH